jgi:hypothetical protein
MHPSPPRGSAGLRAQDDALNRRTATVRPVSSLGRPGDVTGRLRSWATRARWRATALAVVREVLAGLRDCTLVWRSAHYPPPSQWTPTHKGGNSPDRPQVQKKRPTSFVGRWGVRKGWGFCLTLQSAPVLPAHGCGHDGCPPARSGAGIVEVTLPHFSFSRRRSDGNATIPRLCSLRPLRGRSSCSARVTASRRDDWSCPSRVATRRRAGLDTSIIRSLPGRGRRVGYRCRYS